MPIFTMDPFKPPTLTVVLLFMLFLNGKNERTRAPSSYLNHGMIVKCPHGSLNIIIEGNCLWNRNLLLY